MGWKRGGEREYCRSGEVEAVAFRVVRDEEGLGSQMSQSGEAILWRWLKI